MSRKEILCRGEAVALGDSPEAVAAGYDDLEEIKGCAGFGTGPCQGKECLREVALAIAAAGARPPETIAPFTTRPPLVPTELGLLAGRAAPAKRRAGK